MRWLKQRASRVAGTLTTELAAQAITPQGLPARVPVDMRDFPRMALRGQLVGHLFVNPAGQLDFEGQMPSY